jgi:undecaprenyl-diphosphatase
MELTYIQAIVIGLMQGVTELFPVSSLGHSVLVPALFGGSWKHLVTETTSSHSEGSPYLAFIVALHVATAIALLIYFRQDWIRLIKAFFVTLKTRKAVKSDEKLIWLIIIATIPVGVIGLAFEHPIRVLFAKPLAAAIFLTINGVILLAGERLRKSNRVNKVAHGQTSTTRVSVPDTRSITDLSYREAGFVGVAQTLALFAGISRSGISLVAGLVRGLDHEDAARFSFLLATPVILAAGLLKIPSLFTEGGKGILGQALVGSIVAGIAAYISVRFLTKYFEKRTLKPFGIYCLVFGIFCIIKFSV